MKNIALLTTILLLSGCSSVGTGVKWWNPTTWASGSAGSSADKALAKLDGKKDLVSKAAHVEVAKTAEALSSAPLSREVELARRFNENADTLLTQSSGALTLSEVTSLKTLVGNLKSENVEIRATAEKTLKTKEEEISKKSKDLASAEEKLGSAVVDLRSAFDRENALANKYRNIQFVAIGGIVLSLALGALYVYAKYATGGLPKALGSMIASVQRKDPAQADELRNLLDSVTNRHEQKSVNKHFNTSINS